MTDEQDARAQRADAAARAFDAHERGLLRRPSLSRKRFRVGGTPDIPLQIAHVAIRWLEYECPACNEIMAFCADDLQEDAAGWIVPDGPHRYPVCDVCQTQFECPPVRLADPPR